MVTKGRFQTTKNEQARWPFAKFSVTDTEMKTLGTRFICTTDDEIKADQVANALNFNANPRAYGYKLVD